MSPPYTRIHASEISFRPQMVSVLEIGQQMHAPDIILWASKNTSRSMATPGCCTAIQKVYTRRSGAILKGLWHLHSTT